MVTIHIDFVDGTEVSHDEGYELLRDNSSADFTTNDLTFFHNNGFLPYDCDNVVIVDNGGRYIDRNELMSNKDNYYTDKHMRPGHNINKMLLANAFTWKIPNKKK